MVLGCLFDWRCGSAELIVGCLGGSTVAVIFFADCRRTLQLDKVAMKQLGIRVTGSVLSGTMNV